MYEQLIPFVTALEALFPTEGAEGVQPPCSRQQIEELEVRTFRELGAQLPKAYVAFLERWDGISFASLSIFGSKPRMRPDGTGTPIRYLDGVIEANLARRPGTGMDDVLIIAEDGSCIYGLNLVTMMYGRWDIVAEEQELDYSGFEEMLSAAITSQLEGLPAKVALAIGFAESS